MMHDGMDGMMWGMGLVGPTRSPRARSRNCGINQISILSSKMNRLEI